MKRICLTLILTLLSCIGIIANVRVLSVGISEYPESSGWNKINAHNDVELIKSLFPNAILVENELATRLGIERQLKSLTNTVVKGDTVIIHFSGHGQQILTQTSAKEADGVDEAIVPFDAGKRKTASYNGDNHLTDDVFGNAVDGLRRAVGNGGLVIAVIDACHSDSMDKDADDSKEIYRGTDEIFGSETMSYEQISSLREAYHKQDVSQLATSSDMSDVIYLSACRSDQRNYEVSADGNGYGSLTYYFCEAYKENGISDLPKFLSALYSGMENDKTLQFHGQLPAIRNTIGWEAPAKTIPPAPNLGDDSENDDTSFNPNMVWGIFGLAFIVIFIALWIVRKKKK